MELCLPPHCLSTNAKADPRYIHFVADGTDIRNAKGVTLQEPANTCTLSLSQIQLMLKGDLKGALLALWERETKFGLDNAESTATTTLRPHYPFEAFTPAENARTNLEMDVCSCGVSIHESFRTRRIREALPIQPGDHLWLFHKFLEEHYSWCSCFRCWQFQCLPQHRICPGEVIDISQHSKIQTSSNGSKADRYCKYGTGRDISCRHL